MFIMLKFKQLHNNVQHRFNYWMARTTYVKLSENVSLVYDTGRYHFSEKWAMYLGHVLLKPQHVGTDFSARSSSNKRNIAIKIVGCNIPKKINVIIEIE